MPFTIIKGRFEPSFGRPDGDSMRFVSDDPAPLFRLRRRGREPRLNPDNGSIQLRYEAIDTLEASAGPFATTATEANIAFAAENNGQGYICTNQLGPNGRPIAFAFTGEIEAPDGSEIFLTPDAIMPSINIRQLESGLAYPLYYDTLFDDLRMRCTEVSLAAKAEDREVWAEDATNDGAEWTGDPDSLAPIFPKLWRRIDRYVTDPVFFDPDAPFRNLPMWIKMTNEERVAVPGQDCFTGFDNLVEVTDTTVRLTVEPHEMVVISR